MEATKKTDITIQEMLGYADYEIITEGKTQFIKAPQGRYVILSGSRENEVSKELIINAESRGVFSYSLVEALSESGPIITYRALMARVKQKVENRTQNQHPQMELSAGLSADLGFLGAEVRAVRAPYRVYFSKDQDGWLLDAGALNGIQAADTENPAVFALEDETLVQISEVQASFARVINMPADCDRQKVYDAFPRQVARRKLLLAFSEDSDPAIIELFRNMLEPEDLNVLGLMTSGTASHYLIHCKNESIWLSGALPEQKPLFSPVQGANEQAVRDFKTRLLKVVNWENLLKLNNPASSFEQSNLELSIYTPEGELKDVSELNLSYAKTGDQLQQPQIRVKLANKTNESFWIAVMYLDSAFGIYNDLLPVREIHLNDEIWLTAPSKDGRLDTFISLGVPQAYLNSGVNSIRDYIKIIVSNEEFDVYKLVQAPLEIYDARPKTRGPGFGDKVKYNWWSERTVGINIHYPIAETNPASAGEPKSDPEPSPSHSIIYLAFADNQDNPLPNLQEEDQNLNRLLTPRASKGHFLLWRESFASSATIAEDIIRFRDSLTVFHFSGFQKRDTLLHYKEGPVNGIDRLLSQCSQLKLVILNGCATTGQVNSLLEMGVPSVIGTTASIDDRSATFFSTRFFEALVNGFSIKDAFELAFGALEASFSNTPIKRDMSYLKTNSADEPVLGLFFRDEKVLDWKLPNVAKKENSGFKVNEVLIERLINALAPYNQSIQRLLKSEAFGEKVSYPQRRLAIINAFPIQIGENIRRLFVPMAEETGAQSYKQLGLPRLQQLLTIFDTAIELAGFIVLAQVWDVFRQQTAMQWDINDVDTIKNFFKLDQNERRKYFFSKLIIAAHHIIEKNNAPYFISEFSDWVRELISENTNLRQSVDFLEKLKFEISLNSEEEIVDHCINAEAALADMLRAFGFICNYTLVSFKNINVVKNRQSAKPQFTAVIVRLNNILGGLAEEQFVSDYMWDNQSVVVVKNEDWMRGFLNLTPFIIDENSFDENVGIGSIHSFDTYKKEGDAYVYKPVNLSRPPLVIGDQKIFSTLKEQFDDFSRIIFSQTMKDL